MLFFLPFDFIMSRETISRDTGKLLNENPVRQYFLPMQRGTHEHRWLEKYVTRNEKRGCYIFGAAFQPTSRTGQKWSGSRRKIRRDGVPRVFGVCLVIVRAICSAEARPPKRCSVLDQAQASALDYA